MRRPVDTLCMDEQSRLLLNAVRRPATDQCTTINDRSRLTDDRLTTEILFYA